jgi:hypothetical protein
MLRFRNDHNKYLIPFLATDQTSFTFHTLKYGDWNGILFFLLLYIILDFRIIQSINPT